MELRTVVLNFHSSYRRHSILTDAGVWWRRWTQFDGERAARLQCVGPKLYLAYHCMAEYKVYERRLY